MGLMGDQDYDFNYYKSIFNKDSLIDILYRNNFINIKELETKSLLVQSIGDWSDKKLISGFVKTDQGLNLIGVKP